MSCGANGFSGDPYTGPPWNGLVLAAEDIGNAEPYALQLATAAFDAVHRIGMPESRIILSQITTYLAGVPKSNAAYMAIDLAMKNVREEGAGNVPLHLRNAATELMKVAVETYTGETKNNA